MEEVQIGTQEHTAVYVLDGPGPGNACHEYQIVTAVEDKPLGRIAFQRGPVGEVGVNGIHNEDLLAVVVHRLQGFQAGDYKCRENALALTKLEEALHWLRHRTDAREMRGVEGTSQA